MSRAVTADHVLFDECISAFRPNGGQGFRLHDRPSYSYLLTDFELCKDWQFPNCKVHRSVRVHLPGAYSAFISRVDNPETCDSHNSHLYGIALSSIVTFSSGRLCRSTRDDYLCRRESLTDQDAIELSLSYPVLTAGPGGVHTSLVSPTLQKYQDELGHLIERLHEVPYSKYVVLMQAIRLAHLSLLTKRDDFGLAYLLIVSAIESAAQHAINREKVRKMHPNEDAWIARAQQDEEFSLLLKAYRDERGQNKYLKERYVEFINTFAPVSDWEKIVPHPLQDLADYVQDVAPTHSTDHIVEKHWFEMYPAYLLGEEIGTILSDSYVHRSLFIHKGKQPPHQDPKSLNRFFQEYRDGTSITERLLPNYELLFGIAQYSIRNWMDRI